MKLLMILRIVIRSLGSVSCKRPLQITRTHHYKWQIVQVSAVKVPSQGCTITLLQDTPFLLASSLGAAITMPICGYLIASLGWQSVFYVTGGIGFVWSVAWFLLVFDSPAQHPRISDSERRYIEEAIGNTSTKKVSHNFSILYAISTCYLKFTYFFPIYKILFDIFLIS